MRNLLTLTFVTANCQNSDSSISYFITKLGDDTPTIKPFKLLDNQIKADVINKRH